MNHELNNRGAYETDFDFRYGSEWNNLTKMANNMQDVVLKYWALNIRFPSNTVFNN